MTGPAWFSLGLYSTVIVVFLLVVSLRQGNIKSKQKKIYLQMEELTILLLATDMASRWYTGPDWFFPAAQAATYIKYLLYPFLVLCWFRYVSNLVLGKTQRVWYAALAALCGLNMVPLLLPRFCGLVFFFDAQHVYHRGPLYLASNTMVILMLVVSEVFIIFYRRKIARRYLFSLLIFAVPPFVGGLLQTFLYGLPFALFGITLSQLTVFVDIQNRSIDVDYLTGLYNRRCLDNYMDREIQRSEEEPLSAILLDMDHFKQINDLFGHTTGDTALEEAARLMRKVSGVDAFVARYGGDEFCIVLRSAHPEQLASRIRKKMEEYNARGGRLYRLSFSMGYAVYNPQEHLSRVQFQKKIDSLMYEEKRRRHLERGYQAEAGAK